MVKRILSSLALLPILFYVLINGGLPLYIGVFVVSVIGFREFYLAFRLKGINVVTCLGYITSAVFFLFFVFRVGINYINALILLLFFISSILLFSEKYNVIDIAITLLGIIYIPYFMSHIVLIKDGIQGDFIWLIFIIAWMTDTFAYFSGYFFGKHKLIPKVSPKKTVEGSIGGIIGSIISCVIFGYLTNQNVLDMVIIGFMGSIFAQVGDLFASSVKRFVNIKDYGKLIPGHGGILDRFDSIIFTAPVVYHYVSIFIK
ncbi:phosphatidate cytidylyltransferase [Alkalithermobacter thermoalcaliphilus JW-YL-7 = DSM 7308]|uniref:Phosphatidate cytidylyltransferase n=1 Tax=Alkalithermobacter thermoalcaliphilus JW-YL-7 = DSM 7308 TaxID=1121328 RepID=A0A150FRG2_CLOPD|nr:phosphatidate cytidylyltransferase [[Clostridium] paradoxum JW-YL-7 = DSM 7308]SHK59847.1 phosphatidate cytidylyltransferase [[Clostridium] paradoxum JW-YL-7 = DSM 7308]